MQTIYYKVLKTFTTIVEDLNDGECKFIEIPEDTLLRKVNQEDYHFYIDGKIHTLDCDIVENNPDYFLHDITRIDNSMLDEEFDSMKDQFLELYENLCRINNIDYKTNPNNRVLKLINQWAGVEINPTEPIQVNYFTTDEHKNLNKIDILKSYIYSI